MFCTDIFAVVEIIINLLLLMRRRTRSSPFVLLNRRSPLVASETAHFQFAAYGFRRQMALGGRKL